MPEVTWRPSEDKWEGSDSTVKVAGTRYACATGEDWRPDSTLRLGTVRHKARKSDRDGSHDLVAFGKDIRLYPVEPGKARKGSWLTRKAGWVRVTNEDGDVRYVMVLKARRAALLAILASLLAACLALLWSCTGVAPQDVPVYLLDSVGITSNNADAKATIDYASYQSVPDQTWVAGQTTQSCTLALPADVYTTDADGNEVRHDNPVLAAPHIYVDLDGDGQYSEDECVFNPITYKDDGTVEDYGAMLEPGRAITTVELTRALDAGSYDAEVTWTPIMQDTHAIANPMSFVFRLTVQ